MVHSKSLRVNDACAAGELAEGDCIADLYGLVRVDCNGVSTAQEVQRALGITVAHKVADMIVRPTNLVHGYDNDTKPPIDSRRIGENAGRRKDEKRCEGGKWLWRRERKGKAVVAEGTKGESGCGGGRRAPERRCCGPVRCCSGWRELRARYRAH